MTPERSQSKPSTPSEESAPQSRFVTTRAGSFRIQPPADDKSGRAPKAS
jgi:hypothetical protein